MLYLSVLYGNNPDSPQNLILTSTPVGYLIEWLRSFKNVNVTIYPLEVYLSQLHHSHILREGEQSMVIKNINEQISNK